MRSAARLKLAYGSCAWASACSVTPDIRCKVQSARNPDPSGSIVTCPAAGPARYFATVESIRASMCARKASPMSKFLPETRKLIAHSPSPAPPAISAGASYLNGRKEWPSIPALITLLISDIGKNSRNSHEKGSPGLAQAKLGRMPKSFRFLHFSACHGWQHATNGGQCERILLPQTHWFLGSARVRQGRAPHQLLAFSRRRSTEEGIFRLSRYLATVRRAISTLASLSLTTISSSDRISEGLSRSIICLIRNRTDSAECAALPSCAAIEAVKQYLSSKRPRGVAIYLLEVTRETVDSCTPTASAIVLRSSGRNHSTPCAKNLSCWRTISLETFRIVRALCSRLFVNQLAV